MCEIEWLAVIELKISKEDIDPVLVATQPC